MEIWAELTQNYHDHGVITWDNFSKISKQTPWTQVGCPVSSLANLNCSHFPFLSFFSYPWCILSSFDWFCKSVQHWGSSREAGGCCDNCWRASFLPPPPFQTINVNLFVKTPAFCPKNQPWRQDTFLLFLLKQLWCSQCTHGVALNQDVGTFIHQSCFIETQEYKNISNKGNLMS